MVFIPKHIEALSPYKSARDLYQGNYTFMDANENAMPPLITADDFEAIQDTDISRYPDTDSMELARALSEMYSVRDDMVAIFNGSDSAIPDILFAFSEQGSSVAGLDVGFGMYRSFCDIHTRNYVDLKTDDEFRVVLNEQALKSLEDAHVVFLDAPNNPSGVSQYFEDILEMIEHTKEGVFVLDLAYFGFMTDQKIKELISRVEEFDNLLIMYSFSKTWSFAGGRIGAVFGNPKLINTLKKVRIPYHVDKVSEQLALRALTKDEVMKKRAAEIMRNREELSQELTELGLKVYPSDANFILVKFPENSREIFDRLVNEYKIVLRYFGGKDALAGKASKLSHTIRITVGTKEQNDALIDALKEIL